MNSSQPDRAAAKADALEFEIIDLGDAKHALDELPPGVTELATFAPGYWSSRRRKAAPSDRALTGVAIDWLLALTPSLRPQATCEQFPRVVNAIAAAWALPNERKATLASLMSDTRFGRSGFPSEVHTEIQALHDAA